MLRHRLFKLSISHKVWYLGYTAQNAVTKYQKKIIRIKITMKYMISLHFVIVRKLNIVWPMLEIDLSFFNFSNFEWYEDINDRIVDMITLPTQEIKTLGRVDKKLNFPFDS